MPQHPPQTHYWSPSSKTSSVVLQVCSHSLTRPISAYSFFFHRIAIIGAYFIGTSLFPEAKTYRLAADILNDTAITLDALSPLLNSIRLPFGVRLPYPGSIRVIALCLSGSFRSLCGIAAGGSKTALSTHFASPVTGTCDLGDLTAKDSSRETVISLVGMLVSYCFWMRSRTDVLFI
jgi:hypothetical protein